MTREELIETRKTTLEHYKRLCRLGDHSAEAPDIRQNSETLLKLIDHALETMETDDDAA